MPREIYSIPDLMESIQPIDDRDDKYTEIPNFDGMIEAWTEYAVLIGKHWFPISQLRKSDDESEIFASNWILGKKGL